MRLRRLLVPALLVPGLLAAPVLSLPAAAAPRPVAPVVVEVPLAPSSASTSTRTGRTLVLTEPRATRPYEVVGVTWDAGAQEARLQVQVRTRRAGTWSAWTPLEVETDRPAGAEGEGARPGTSPLWVGRADGVQVRVDLLGGTAPTGLRVSLVDPGDSPADAAVQPVSAAHAAATVPEVRPRAAWGADESIRTGRPAYAPSLQAVTLHHTASSSSYAAEDVPALLRGFYAYHVKSNRWSDIGYNFLVDRFGRVWEGRAGGTTRHVIGAHAGGFNTGTVGVSMIGTYESEQPSPAMLESVAQVAGWRLGLAGLDPEGSVTLTSAGSSRFPSGTAVRLPRLFGHRAVSTTSCPGTKGVAALPGLRARAAALAAGAAPQEPVADGTLRVDVPAVAPPGSTVDVVVHGPAGRPVQLWFAGTGTAGAGLRRDAAFAEDGTYRTTFTAGGTHTLFAVSDGRSSPRVQTRSGTDSAPVSVAPSPLAVTGPVTAEAGTTALLTVSGPPGTPVSVWFRREAEQSFVRRREGVLGEDGTWTTGYTASEPLEYFAMSPTTTSADATTLVGPVPNGLHVTAPPTATGGTSVPLVVQGAPGAAVELWFSRSGGPFTRRREGVLGADGTFRTAWSASEEHTVYAVARGRTSTRVTTRVPGSVPYGPADGGGAPAVTAAVPPVVDAGAPVELTVTGRPGAPVQVWFRSREETVFTQRRAGVLDAEGAFRTTFSGLDDHDVYATTGGTASRDAVTTVRPVLTAPAVGHVGRTVVLTGRARPGDRVVVEQQRRSGSPVRRTATAGSTGRWRLPLVLTDASRFRASVGDRVGADWAGTEVAPTLTAPARTGRGSTVRLVGTARPGATVEVLFRPRGGTLFVVRRAVVADAVGRWATTAAFAVDHRVYARADGRATRQAVVDVR